MLCCVLGSPVFQAAGYWIMSGVAGLVPTSSMLAAASSQLACNSRLRQQQCVAAVLMSACKVLQRQGLAQQRCGTHQQLHACSPAVSDTHCHWCLHPSGPCCIPHPHLCAAGSVRLRQCCVAHTCCIAHTRSHTLKCCAPPPYLTHPTTGFITALNPPFPPSCPAAGSVWALWC